VIDVTCTRGPDGTVTCSIPQAHKHHSPTGFEIGYGGSGPADLALNILAAAIGPAPDPGPEPDEDSSPDAWEVWAERDAQRVKLYDGSYAHADAWDLHEPFKWELIATLPREGGTIPGVVIEAWLTVKRRQLEESADVD
jgi:hypothetical protein